MNGEDSILEEVRVKAEAGHVVAQGFLGTFYLFGDEGLDVDYELAFKWLSAAAEKGAYRPTAHLARMYEGGMGRAKDIAEAIRLFKKAALRGDADAAMDLGRIYFHGTDVPVDIPEAVRWYTIGIAGNYGIPEMDWFVQIKDTVSRVNGVEAILTNLLQFDPEDFIRVSAAQTLGQLNIYSAIPVILSTLENAPPAVRPGMTAALGRFSKLPEYAQDLQIEVRDVLLGLMNDDAPHVRSMAALAIGKGGHDTPESRKRLWLALDGVDSDVQGRAAYTLAILGDSQLSDRLDALLRSSTPLSPYVFAAAQALGDSALLPALLIGAERYRSMRLMYHPDDEMIASAIEALSAQD